MFKEYPDVLTVRQVSEALGIGINSAYRLVHERSIGYKKIGKKILVPKTCLLDYVQSARYTVSDL